MSIKFYNTLTRKKEEFVPLDPEGKRVNMYTCGVTVYDKCHIGHARSLYIFDMIRRYLKFRGFDVKFARNITDVDDKIINKANELGKTFEEVVDENIELYKIDLESLGILDAIEPRATQNIDEMITHIQGLIDKDFAYESDGDVYFKVRAFKDYGKLSGQSVDQMLDGVRIEKGSKKKDALDFVLWKKAKEGEPFWSSPWGEGRPGWHIECSVMSLKELECETLDIHAGGLDLKFPHHENEIAQSEALTGKPFAKYWIHHGLLTINKQKMAKSLGNFITVEDALKKYSVNELKLFFLSTHYRSHIDFSETAIEDAGKNNVRLIRLKKDSKDGIDFSREDVREFNERLNSSMKVLRENVDSLSEDEKEELEIKEGEKKYHHFSNFIKAMDDDFNTPQALAVINYMIRESNTILENNLTHKESWKKLLYNYKTLLEIADILGLDLDISDELNAEEQVLYTERKTARKNKDFKRSDKLRDQLLKEKGIIVEDGKDGQTWRRA